MSKRYILFNNEELEDMMNGIEIEHPLEDGTVVYFMSKEYYDQQHTITDEKWQKAIEYLNMLILMYASIGVAGSFGLTGVLSPLKTRYENGERTKALYDSIMACE